MSMQGALPATRYAVESYVYFVREQPLVVAAASSLTELFAPQIHQSRLDSWPQHYPWIDPAGYDVVVNATPLGMKDGDPLPMDVARISPSAFVGEVVDRRHHVEPARERQPA